MEQNTPEIWFLLSSDGTYMLNTSYIILNVVSCLVFLLLLIGYHGRRFNVRYAFRGLVAIGGCLWIIDPRYTAVFLLFYSWPVITFLGYMKQRFCKNNIQYQFVLSLINRSMEKPQTQWRLLAVLTISINAIFPYFIIHVSSMQSNVFASAYYAILFFEVCLLTMAIGISAFIPGRPLSLISANK